MIERDFAGVFSSRRHCFQSKRGSKPAWEHNSKRASRLLLQCPHILLHPQDQKKNLLKAEDHHIERGLVRLPKVVRAVPLLHREDPVGKRLRAVQHALGAEVQPQEPVGEPEHGVHAGVAEAERGRHIDC